MSSWVSQACFRRVSLEVFRWALAALIASACATPLAPPSEHGGASQNARDAVAERETLRELGTFTRVQAAEIAMPIPERPVPIASSDDSGPSHRGVHLNRCGVERTIRKHLPTFRACYERESRHDPNLSGKVTVAFVIQPDGYVRDAETIENSTGSAAVAACVSSGLRQIRFARGTPRGRVSCVYPFLFAGKR